MDRFRMNVNASIFEFLEGNGQLQFICVKVPNFLENSPKLPRISNPIRSVMARMMTGNVCAFAVHADIKHYPSKGFP